MRRFIKAVLLVMLGAASAQVTAAAQQAFTVFHGNAPTVTTVNTVDTVLILQGGTLKQAPITLVRGNTVTASSTLVSGNCIQATGAATIASAAGPCVIPGPAPFLMAQ